MNLFLAGLDHTTAPLEIRERLAFNASDIPAALLQLTTYRDGVAPLLSEAAILSTCNRVEIYGVTGESGTAHQVVKFLADFHKLTEEQFVHTLFFYTGELVVRHICETASGLRSLVLGEAQIQGQVRTAFETAQHTGTAGPILSHLFRHALAAGKHVRHETTLGIGAASVSQAGVELARQRLGCLEGRTVLLVGSGEVSELAAQNLLSNGARDLWIVNRTLAHASELAARYSAQAFGINDLARLLPQADIIISSTAAPVPIIYRSHIEQAMHIKAEHNHNGSAPTMMLIDLAVPRDIDPAVAELPGVHLYTVDALQEVINHTLEQRHTCIATAEKLVEHEVQAFIDWLRSQDAMPALAALRQRAESVRCHELERALRNLVSLSPEQQYVVEAFSRSLVNKLLHTPTVRVKTAAAHGEGQRYAAMLYELFNLETV
jgi:glutamyl-tRNA reductase